MQRCRFEPVIFSVKTENKPTKTSPNAPIIDRAIFCPDFFIA